MLKATDALFALHAESWFNCTMTVK